MSEWIRDLTEEGIEPNPGPWRFISHNTNGVATEQKLKNLMRRINRINETPGTKDQIASVAIQEHNLNPKNASAHQRAAKWERCVLLTGYNRSGSHRGGTAIIVPYSTIDANLDKTSSRAREIDKIRSGAAYHAQGRITQATITVDGHKLRITSAYAPVRGHERPGFFDRLAKYVTRRTILCIDANCVPDEYADLCQVNPTSKYDNKGADELAALVEEKDLEDTARLQAGPATPVFTCHSSAAGGGVTKTRIDQIYTPVRDALIWTADTCHAMLPPRPEGSPLRDHVPIEVSLVTAEGERGRDLSRIDEKIFDKASNVDAMAKIITTTYETLDAPRAAGGHSPTEGEKWELIKSKVRTKGLELTQQRRKVERKDTAKLRARAKELEDKVDEGTATVSEYAEVSRTQEKARESSKSDWSLWDTLESFAFHRHDKHDTGSRAMHRQFTPKNAAQWINSLTDFTWPDPSNPTPPPEDTPPVSQASDIPRVATKYFKALFQRKTPAERANAKCQAPANTRPQP